MCRRLGLRPTTPQAAIALSVDTRLFLGFV